MARSARTEVELLSRQVTEAAYFFLNPAPRTRAPLEISMGGRELCNPDYMIRRRQYGYTVLEYVVEGAGEVVLDGNRFLLGPGSAFAYQKDTACEIHTDPTRRLLKYFLCLSGRNAPALLSRAGIAPARAVKLTAQAEIQSVFAQIIKEGQARTSYSRAMCNLLLQVLLLKIRETLTQRVRRPAASYEQYIRLKQLIDSETTRLRTLSEVAAKSGLSVVAACKLFHQHLGLSPFRYLMRRKLEIAAELLVRRHILVKEAAAEVGFADPYHFSRRFKQTYGVSPAAMRENRG